MESEDLEMFFKNTNKRKNYIDPELKTNLIPMGCMKENLFYNSVYTCSKDDMITNHCLVGYIIIGFLRVRAKESRVNPTDTTWTD